MRSAVTVAAAPAPVDASNGMLVDPVSQAATRGAVSAINPIGPTAATTTATSNTPPAVIVSRTLATFRPSEVAVSSPSSSARIGRLRIGAVSSKTICLTLSMSTLGNTGFRTVSAGDR